MIYATVVLWKHLSDNNRLILTHFVKICQILVSRILKHNIIKETHKRLVKMVKIIEQYYGQEKITPNLHLSLHLCECANDYGPLYAFWCFSFERMNGMLGTLPNSHRNIEQELMRRLLNDKKIDLITSTNETRGSLFETGQFSFDEMHQFLINTNNIQESVINGSERFPGELLHPQKLNLIVPPEMLNLLI